MNSKLKTLITILLISAVAIFYYQKYKVAPQLKMDDVQLTDLNENAFDLTSLKGKTVVFTVWATWCPPCVKEMPLLLKVAEDYKDKDVVFVMASDETIAKIKHFQENRGINFPLYHLTEEMKHIGVYSIPTTFIFDKKGKLVHGHVGEFTNEDELKTAIKKGL